MSYTWTDDKARTVLDSTPNLFGLHYTYNDSGFLVQTRQGDRITSFDYNALGRLETITDPLGRSTTMEYDAVGRVTKQTLSDGREIGYSYDANGNLVALSPPGRSAHFFDYTPVNLTSLYLPPEVSDSTGLTTYDYNLDRQLVGTTFSDSSLIQVVYDTSSCGCSGGSKPLKIITPACTTDFKYSESTGKLSEIQGKR